MNNIPPDRISGLPEPIIHRILSLLPTKSVKLASSLSKTWYHFCSSFPYLDFVNSFETMHDEEEILDYDSNDNDFDLNLKPSRERYLNYIGQTLRRFHDRNPRILIRRLRIPITLINSSFVSILGDLIRLALEHGVEKIDLKCSGHWFNLPGEVFTSDSIRVLKLVGCRLLDSYRRGDISVASSKLRKLVIIAVHTDEVALRSVISSCPLLEKLAIQDAIGLRNLRISRHNNLKSLVVSNVGSGVIKMVEVDAPMLHSLELRNFDQPHCKIGILECPRLAKLTLNNVEVDNFQLEEILSRLPFLGSLRLTNLLLLTKFKISNDSLNKLEIIRCTDLVELEIDTPNLLSFEFEGDVVPLMVPVHTIMGQTNITLVSGPEPSSYDNFGVKFRNFLSRLHRVNYLSLHLKDFAMINVDEPEERVVQPVPDIEELKIIVQMPNSLQDIFNGLLRSFHPRIMTMQLVLFENSGVMKFLRDIMVSGGPCCSWLPYLEEMTIVVDNDNIIRLPMDGTVPSIVFALESCFWEIKIVFKWISIWRLLEKRQFLKA